MNADELLARIRSASRYLRDIADPGYGDYNLNDALQCAVDLAADCLALDRALAFGLGLPVAWTEQRSVEVTEPLTRIPGRLRALAARLVEDNDDSPDDAAEQGCALARGVLDLDAASAAVRHSPLAAGR